MNDNDKQIPFYWAVLLTFSMWGFFGWLFYSLGLTARAVLLR